MKKERTTGERGSQERTRLSFCHQLLLSKPHNQITHIYPLHFILRTFIFQAYLFMLLLLILILLIYLLISKTFPLPRQPCSYCCENIPKHKIVKFSRCIIWQATQTDDEAEESPRSRAIRPTNFGRSESNEENSCATRMTRNAGDIGNDFSEQVRSAEVLNKQRALQNPLTPAQVIF